MAVLTRAVLERGLALSNARCLKDCKLDKEQADQLSALREKAYRDWLYLHGHLLIEAALDSAQ